MITNHYTTWWVVIWGSGERSYPRCLIGKPLKPMIKNLSCEEDNAWATKEERLSWSSYAPRSSPSSQSESTDRLLGTATACEDARRLFPFMQRQRWSDKIFLQPQILKRLTFARWGNAILTGGPVNAPHGDTRVTQRLCRQSLSKLHPMSPGGFPSDGDALVMAELLGRHQLVTRQWSEVVWHPQSMLLYC